MLGNILVNMCDVKKKLDYSPIFYIGEYNKKLDYSPIFYIGEYNAPTMLPAGSIVGALYHSCKHSLALPRMGEIIARNRFS